MRSWNFDRFVVAGLALSASMSAYAQSAPRAAEAAAADDYQARFADVRKAIAATLEEAKVPSIALAVVKDGRIIWEEGFGWADKERQIAASAHTPYSLASMTKPVTATAIMNLHEAGKIDIDTPIERYLGGIRLTGHAGSSNGVTARRIMAHSAGLPQYGHFYLDGATPAGSRDSISKFGLVVFPPNTRFEYSNIGMKILDAAIEQVSGQSFGDYLRSEIFLPLGMKNSAVGLPPGVPAATRYDNDRKPMRFYLTDHPGSGDVWASAHDVARFLAFHMGTPLPDQRPVLTPATRSVMQLPASATPMPMPPDAPRRDVGANWILSTINGHPQVWHSGGQPGVSAFMAFYPHQKLAIVLLANSSAPLGRVSQAIRNAIAPEVSPPEEGQPPAPRAIPYRGEWTGTVTNYAGEQPIALAFEPNGEVRVKLGNEEPAALEKAAFSDGAVTGSFSGTVEIPEAKGLPQNLVLKVVRVGDELVGQLITQAITEDVALMLPSFVRLRTASQRR